MHFSPKEGQKLVCVAASYFSAWTEKSGRSTRRGSNICFEWAESSISNERQRFRCGGGLYWNGENERTRNIMRGITYECIQIISWLDIRRKIRRGSGVDLKLKQRWFRELIKHIIGSAESDYRLIVWQLSYWLNISIRIDGNRDTLT